MEKKRTYKVKEVADVANVSVRTLHHYDAIGLLSPRGRSRSGYRIYDHDDLLRLQQIVVLRDFGMPLEEIRRTLDDPAFDHEKALVDQRAVLLSRLDETAAKLRAVDAALALVRGKKEDFTMSTKSMFEGFEPSTYEEEARARWGETDAYAESTRRAKAYREEDWARFRVEQESIHLRLVAVMDAGEPATSEPAMDAAEEHRLAIDRWFYRCGHEMHRRLADLYEADPRFAANIDRYRSGLTPWLAAAIRANASRRHDG